MAETNSPARAPTFRNLAPGDRLPRIQGRTDLGSTFVLDSAAGRWLVIGLPLTLADGRAGASVAAALAASDVFDDLRAALFLVTADPRDLSERGLASALPGRRVYVDPGGAIARELGALPRGTEGVAGQPLRRLWLIADPSLFIRRVIPMRPDGAEVPEMLAWLRAQPPAGLHMGFELPVPILVLPHVFEPEFCDRLIALYEAQGGEISGFMRQVGGRTLPMHDPSFKSRRDYVITDPELIAATRARIRRRVVPEIERVHYFRCTRMERYIVSCYDAAEGGHFRAHRDNTTSGTAHRRYAVSINLNDDFEGGAVSFPEYSPRGFRAPKGGAVIFSCSMLHEVGRVTAGRRYAFLPFLYDEAAARIREANAALVGPEGLDYRA